MSRASLRTTLFVQGDNGDNNTNTAAIELLEVDNTAFKTAEICDEVVNHLPQVETILQDPRTSSKHRLSTTRYDTFGFLQLYYENSTLIDNSEQADQGHCPPSIHCESLPRAHQKPYK
jgi:hypothetical protein